MRSFKDQMNDHAAEIIIEALKACDGNQAAAAETLNLNPRSIYNYRQKRPEINEYIRPYNMERRNGNKKWERYPN